MRHLSLTSAQATELTEDVLARGGEISFRAQGSSMRPFLKDGDYLRVVRSPTRQLAVGDIILYRAGKGGLAAHRLVGWRKKGNKRTIVARGDSPGSVREEVQEPQVIGVVVASRRGGTSRDLQGIKWRSAGLLWSLLPSPLRSCLSPGIIVRRLASSLLARLRSLPEFRQLLRAVLGRYVRYGKISVGKDQPLWGGLAAADRGLRLTREESELAANGHFVVAVIGRHIVGRLHLSHFSDHAELYPGWWIFGMEVRPLFRGAGLGENLVRTALELARHSGAEKVCLLVGEQNYPAIQAYRKVGFIPATYPALERVLDEERSRGIPCRHLMVRHLSSD